MTSRTRTLLVIERNVRLAKDAHEKLEQAGYVVVRGDPTEFHLIDGLPDQDASILFTAAVAVLRAKKWGYHADTGEAIRARFAQEIIDLLDSRKNAGGSPSTEEREP